MEFDQLGTDVNRFLSKASKRNEPLESFRDTEAFKDLEELIASGLRKQSNWIKRNWNDEKHYADESLTKSQFEAEFGSWLNRAMPRLKEYVSEDKVYKALHAAFVWSIQASYARLGVVAKGVDMSPINFELTNPQYIAKLKDAANYLLNKSTIDETTRREIISTISTARENLATIDEVAGIIDTKFEEVSAARAFVIANTEANRAMSTAQMAFMNENDVKTKSWVPAGPSTCAVCQGNADDGEIGIHENFSSGDSEPPGHPNCECYLEAGMIDLESIPVFWDGGGGGEVAAAAGDPQRPRDVKNLVKESNVMNEIANELDKQTELREQIKTSEEKVAAATARKLAQLDKEHVSGEVIKEVSANLQTQIEAVRKKMQANAEWIAKELEKNGRPQYKTIMQKMEFPAELTALLKDMAKAATLVPETPISMDDYKPHDQSEGDVDYYGFLHPNGSWYIMRGADDKQRYVAGTSGYAQAWTDRTKHTYGYINEAFNNG